MAWKINSDPVDRMVRGFMAVEGIDVDRVAWYRVTKEHDDLAMLELKMYMNDKTPPRPATGGVVQAKVQPYLVGESGPELAQKNKEE